jgi:putative chitinase
VAATQAPAGQQRALAPVASNGTTSSGQAAAAQSASVRQSPAAGQGQSADSSQSASVGVTSTSSSGASGASGGPFRAYRVQPGDTVKFVAQAYGVSVASIAQASGLRNPDQLDVGQVLTVPTQPGWLYSVQPGETLDQIAARAGVSSQVIASVSGLSGELVRAGDVVLIPDQASLAAAGK